MPVDLEFLKKIPYFAGLGADVFEIIGGMIFEKPAERGEIVLYEGDPAEALFFVYSGAVKVFKTSAEGKEQILAIVRPGESFNDVSIFDDGPNAASAQTLAPVVLYELRKSDIEELLGSYPQVAANTVQVLAKRVRELVSLVEDLSFRHVIGRVARILLERAGDSAEPGPRLTQQDMAAMAGTAREVVGRSLKTLEDEGIIRLERNRVVIADKDALRGKVETAF